MNKLNIEIAPSRYSSRNSTYDLTLETSNSGITKTGLSHDDLIRLREAIDSCLTGIGDKEARLDVAVPSSAQTLTLQEPLDIDIRVGILYLVAQR